jgi:ferredoxin
MLITKEGLKKLAERLLGEGIQVAAPTERANQPVYAALRSADEMALDHQIPRNSFKEFLFPQTEVVARFAISKGAVNLASAGTEFPETVVLGARPCDAASVASLRSVFTWKGEDDRFFTGRQDKSAVVTIACTKGDGACFCTSVGLAPDSPQGSDILLRPTVSGGFRAEALTERGKALAAGADGIFTEGDEELAPVTPPPAVESADVEKILAWLSDTENYKDALWAAHAGKCVGCGACTYVCPTCHCFDIVDEGRAFEGERRKNWDACQFDHFTAHAGGHNPREKQSQRWRNRFMCKFHYYPTKFDSRGCVGCGRCVRVCCVGLDITEMMQKVTGKAVRSPESGVRS